MRHLKFYFCTFIYVSKSPRTVPFFLLVTLLNGYSFANVLVKGIVAFKH